MSRGLERAAAAVGLVLFGIATTLFCRSCPDHPPHASPPKQTVTQHDALVHLVGRFDLRDPAGPRFAWPGSSLAARFVGTGVSVRLADAGTNSFSVVIDGRPATVLATSGPARTYALAGGLGYGEHALVLTKRTESYVGVVQYLGLAIADGSAIPFVDPIARRIEYVGDSISCGYGVHGANASCPFSPETEDETAAYGALAARELDATRTVIAYSGIGVLRDSSGSTVDPMSVRFERTLADDPTSEWSFATPAPDVVVVHLGTNDFNIGDPGPPFQLAYVALIQRIRGHYPRADIVCALSPMLGGPARAQARSTLRGAVSRAAATGVAHVFYFEFDEQVASDGLGCDYHPNVKTQALMSAKLVPFLRTLTGW